VALFPHVEEVQQVLVDLVPHIALPIRFLARQELQLRGVVLGVQLLILFRLGRRLHNDALHVLHARQLSLHASARL